jgi:hypothetical protein
MLDLTATEPATVEKYANLIATRDLIKLHPEYHSQGSWYGNNLYCFAGFAYLLKEGKTVGDSIPDQDPYLANWLGMSLEDYDILCYRLDTTEEVLDAIEDVLAGRTVYDSDGLDFEGFDINGYDAENFDRQDFDVDGYDRSGYDRSGYDRDGFNWYGFDESGYDREGFNASGYDRDGFNWEGLNPAGFDAEGYNYEGYDIRGYDREGFDRNGFDFEGEERE